MLYQAEFWVAVAFVIFLAVLWYVGAHRAILSSLDTRSERIRFDLEEARRLREEAEKVLAEYKQRRRQAEAEAQAILEQTRTEAAEFSAESEARMTEFVARRTRLAEAKIAQAEAQALAEVRSAAAEAAVKAAEKILSDTVKGKVADDLIAAAIKDVKTRLG